MTQFFSGYPENWTAPIWLTIGNFDGMHLGHQSLIDCVCQTAREKCANAGLITFNPHPKVFFQNLSTPFYLATDLEKTALIKKTGLDLVVTLPFVQELAEQTPEMFLSALTHHLNVEGLVVGQNFSLGKGGSGTTSVLRKICSDLGVQFLTVEPLSMDGVIVSSARVRELVETGNVSSARRLLGRPYSVANHVIRGKGLGSKLGFPTANIMVDPMKLLPKYGVYATVIQVNGDRYLGVTNVGIRPTFETASQPTIETLLLDFDGNIYQEYLQVNFIERIRNERKFASGSELITQIESDKIQARRILTNEPESQNLST